MDLNNIFESPILTDDEFLIKQSFIDAHKSESPTRLRHGYICICQQGKAELVLNMNHLVVESNKLIIIFPDEVVELSNISADFSFLFIRMSPRFMSEILFRFPPSFIGFIKEMFYYQMSQEEFDMFYNEFFRILKFRYNNTSCLCRREIIANILRNFFLDIYDKIKRDKQLSRSSRSRKNEIMEQFCELVIRNFRTSREVSFYADKLFITPKYLSIILKELDVRKRSAKEWIDDYTITEIKLKLKSSDLSILEISNELNFPSLSFLCKYFKSRTGLTPKEYRRQIK